MQPWRWVHHRPAQSYHPRISYAYQESIVAILFIPSSYLSYYQKECWLVRVGRTACQIVNNAPKIFSCQYMAGWKWWRPNAPAHKRKNLARHQCGYAPHWNHCDEVLVQIRCVLCQMDTKWFYFWGAGCVAREFPRHVLACTSHRPPRVVVYGVICHSQKIKLNKSNARYYKHNK